MSRASAFSCRHHRSKSRRCGDHCARRDTDGGEFCCLQCGSAGRREGGTATPTTKDYMRAEAALKSGTVIPDSSDPQLAGMTPEGMKDAAYQAAYRTCMRKLGF